MLRLGLLVSVAICYFFYNYYAFAYISRSLNRKPLKWQYHVLTFFINYGAFVAVSLWGVYLIVNWIMFAVLLTAEVAVIYRTSFSLSFSCGLSGTTVGLSVNICTRSIAALLTKLPFTYFDSRMHVSNEIENLKRYPIAIGFILSGLIFFVLYRHSCRREIYQGGYSEQGVLFFNRLLAALFAYMALNLLFFSTPVNDRIIKLWELKTGLCALTGFLVGIHYAASLNRLKLYEIQGKKVREELKVRQIETEDLEQQAYTDCLTGCFTLEYGLNRLSSLFEKKLPFYLCFADADGLKAVNDTFGHYYGDRYLSAVAHVLKNTLRNKTDVLFRYGGDEFVLLFTESELNVVEQLMKNADQALAEITGSSEYPFTLSIHYGIVYGPDYDTVTSLLETAGRQIYESRLCTIAN